MVMNGSAVSHPRQQSLFDLFQGLECGHDPADVLTLAFLVHGKCFEVANGMRLHPGFDIGIEITATDRTVPFVHCCIPSEDIASDISQTLTGITVSTIYKLPHERPCPEIIDPQLAFIKPSAACRPTDERRFPLGSHF